MKESAAGVDSSANIEGGARDMPSWSDTLLTTAEVAALGT